MNGSGRPFDTSGGGRADLVLGGEGPFLGAPYLVTPYRREMLHGASWHSLLATVGLLEVLTSWLRLGSYAVGWVGSVSIGTGWFAAGVILNAVFIRVLGSRVQPWTLAEPPVPPPGSDVERRTRTALRVSMTSWPEVFGLAVGVALPPLGGVGGGFALASAWSLARNLQRASRAEQLHGWRLFSEAPQRLHFIPPRVPESGYYRVEQAMRSST